MQNYEPAGAGAKGLDFGRDWADRSSAPAQRANAPERRVDVWIPWTKLTVY